MPDKNLEQVLQIYNPWWDDPKGRWRDDNPDYRRPVENLEGRFFALDMVRKIGRINHRGVDVQYVFRGFQGEQYGDEAYARR